MNLAELVLSCAPLVNPVTAHAVIAQESGGNPYAIGVVGDSLVRQPRTKAEALATARALERRGYKFSVGLGQIYVGNWSWLGLDMEKAFDPCANLQAMQTVLATCYQRALGKFSDEQQAVQAAFSCYYSNNFTTGFREGYVQSVVANAARERKKLTKDQNEQGGQGGDRSSLVVKR